jgi:putative hydrolase of the HAD superfamily
MRAEARGLLVDYGGVLTGPIDVALTNFCRGHGLADDAFATLYAPDCAFREEIEAYERGRYDDEAFLPRFAAALGVDPVVMKGFLAGVRPDARMFRALASIRAQGVRVGLLSNSWGMSAYPADLFAGAFDAVVISGLVGMRKPEPAIYRHAADRIGLEPEACVFVDDSAANLAPAVAVGMTVVHHQDAVATLRALEQRFGIPIEGAR